MSCQPNEHEIASVLRLTPDRQYAYLVSKAVDWLELWSCKSADGWVLSSHGNRECVPLWPAAAYAGLCCKDEWAGAAPEAIALDLLIARWLPGMERDNRLAAVFPTPNGRMIVVEPRQLLEDIEEMLGSV